MTSIKTNNYQFEFDPLIHTNNIRLMREEETQNAQEFYKLIKKSNATLVGFATIIDRSSKKTLKIKKKIQLMKEMTKNRELKLQQQQDEEEQKKEKSSHRKNLPVFISYQTKRPTTMSIPQA